jgi:hypothetical protein
MLTPEQQYGFGKSVTLHKANFSNHEPDIATSGPYQNERE